MSWCVSIQKEAHDMSWCLASRPLMDDLTCSELLRLGYVYVTLLAVSADRKIVEMVFAWNFRGQ